MIKSAVLIANGNVSKTNYVNKVIESNDYFISIDAKSENLKELGVQPNLILGDLDSATIDELDSKIEVVELSDQNKTDLEKSLDYCKENSIKKSRDIRKYRFEGRSFNGKCSNSQHLLRYFAN